MKHFVAPSSIRSPQLVRTPNYCVSPFPSIRKKLKAPSRSAQRYQLVAVSCRSYRLTRSERHFKFGVHQPMRMT